MAEVRRGFELTGDGLRAASARAALVDSIVQRLWRNEVVAEPKLAKGIAIAGIGGFGRGLLFPYSDVDLLVCVEKSQVSLAKLPISRLSQQLWDCGLKVSLASRQPGECDRFEPTNPEFGISLLDLRSVAGDAELFAKLRDRAVAKMRQRDGKSIAAELARLTRERHGKYGNTLFHLEPNIKECPGGLRDANVCEWLRSLRKDAPGKGNSEFSEALAFLAAVRCFLHYRHERDDNTLDWLAQDAAAESRIGLGRVIEGGLKVDAAYWMRAYFRQARVVERSLLREAEHSGQRMEATPEGRRVKIAPKPGYKLDNGRIELQARSATNLDPAQDAETVLSAFADMAVSGTALTPLSEERIADAIPLLSASLEEGPGLWQRLAKILTGERAGAALRSMHALGVLELILPEFHGIDALVIRDAYHRYTVDEHTFVLIDTLHGLETDPGKGAPDWRVKFHSMIRELQNPALLYLAALLHDTGKGRAVENHALESTRMARGVIARLEMDSYDAALILQLIEIHLEMSAAVRRDIFDAETVRSFAAKVETHELLRMLTLFTYADIAAVHPDALTPWKAENLWRLSMATANHLDRNVDEDRFHASGVGGVKGEEFSNSATTVSRDKLARVLALSRGREAAVQAFLEGFPERYLSTRTPEAIINHFQMTQHFKDEAFQIAFQHGPVNEITLVTQDRPRLFAGMAAALAAWGMNVVTADAFANADGVVVDTFRFTDIFRTLEMNQSERDRFIVSILDLVCGRASVERLLGSRRRGRRKAPRVIVETSIVFDNTASTQSTLLQIVAQDVPGLLRAISATFGSFGLNLEVALIDTEGETAIDVFYVTSNGAKLDGELEQELCAALEAAIAENAALGPE
ncbi:HD domain-containing protein [Granulicella sp. 5B5]|uniref:[protein-PII] uridylyltransferase family protein n=1 Tax=Granulicella sp. 5B5 TaxID=1617967 RepID=UPI0015F42471|nr:ACT domain-containing protein [Granulicella sp. 5B5]QMV19972.1 HD domain-containing protein [Granulicella sp. 5B5]